MGATPLPWISKGSPIPLPLHSRFLPGSSLQVEEPWTFSVAPSTMGATPLPWISKGSPIPLPLHSRFLPGSSLQVEELWTFSVAPSTMGATPLPWISKGSPIPSPSPVFLYQPGSCTILGASPHHLLQPPCTKHSVCTVILLLVVNSKVISDCLERIKIKIKIKEKSVNSTVQCSAMMRFFVNYGAQHFKL